MQRFNTWAALVVGLVTMTVAGCGGNNSNSSDSASVRVVNATTTHASVALLANAGAAIGATAIDTASAYASVSSGGPTLQLNDAGTGSALSTTSPSLSGNNHYTLVAYESGGAVRTTLISEDNALPSAGVAGIRVFDAATDAGAIDVYVTDPAVNLSTVSTPSFSFGASTSTLASSFLTFAPSTYRIRVTGAGNPADVRLDIPSVVLSSQQLATIVLTPTTGGTLANGSVLVQQGAYTPAHNNSARVRLVAAVGGSAVVSAAAGAAPIATGVVAPSVGAYALVSAAAPITVTVNGSAVAAPAGALSAGGDATLVVYGSGAGTAIARLIADDNHLPASTSNLKMRLFNGLTGNATPLTLSADFSVLAANVPSGTASAYGIVPANTSMRLDVTSANQTVYSESGLNVRGNAVYTLFLLGDASAPAHVLRSDR